MLELLHEAEDWVLGRWRCPNGGPKPGVVEIARRHEVVIPVSGIFVREREGCETVASSVRAVLADAGDTYEVRHPIAGGDECIVVLLGEGAWDDVGRATRLLDGGSEPRFVRHELPIPASAFLMAAELARRGGSRESLQLECASALLLDRLAGDARPASPPRVRTPNSRARHRRAVGRGVAFMTANLASPVTLAEIASEASYSPFHFARVFRNVTGISPYRYFLRLRLRSIAVELQEGAPDLSRLALSTGFASHSHMTSAFRREFGLTPSRFRARS